MLTPLPQSNIPALKTENSVPLTGSMQPRGKELDDGAIHLTRDQSNKPGTPQSFKSQPRMQHPDAGRQYRRVQRHGSDLGGTGG